MTQINNVNANHVLGSQESGNIQALTDLYKLEQDASNPATPYTTLQQDLDKVIADAPTLSKGVSAQTYETALQSLITMVQNGVLSPAAGNPTIATVAYNFYMALYNQG